jgi:hypothetical protein
MKASAVAVGQRLNGDIGADFSTSTLLYFVSFVSSWWIFDPGRPRAIQKLLSYAEGPNAEARSIHTLAGCGRPNR